MTQIGALWSPVANELRDDCEASKYVTSRRCCRICRISKIVTSQRNVTSHTEMSRLKVKGLPHF